MSETNFVIDKPALEVHTERVYKATPERLWQACTDSEQIRRWWGPGELTTIIEKNELSVGGAWRYIQHAPDGSVHPFSGVYREVDEPHKIVRTFEYEPIPGHVLVETLLLDDLGDGTTKLTTIAKYENIGDLEGMVSMGMEGGQRESMDRLATLVEAA